MCTLVEELSKCYDYFLRLLGFPDLLGKILLITFMLSLIDFSTTFLKEQCKRNSFISSFLMQKDYKGYN